MYLQVKDPSFFPCDWTVYSKDDTIKWHKDKLSELGEKLIEVSKTSDSQDERLFNEDYGDYFSEM